MNPKQKLTQIHQNYGIDRRELGKIMVIVSTTLLLVSIHTALTLQQTNAELDKASNSLDRVYGIVGQEDFQDSVNDLKALPDSTLKNRLITVFDALDKAESSRGSMNSAETKLEETYKVYQWMVVIGILGNVAGIAVVYS